MLNTTIARNDGAASAARHITRRGNHLVDPRRVQLVAVLYAHGGGMALNALLADADSPPLVEAIIDDYPDWFVVGYRTVRLAWVPPQSVRNAHARAVRRGEV